MNSASRYFWPLLIFVAFVQTAALFKIVYDKDSLLKSGRRSRCRSSPSIRGISFAAIT